MTGIDFHTHLAPRLDPADAFDVPKALHEPDRLDRHLDSAGLAEAVVMVPPPFYRQHLPATDARSWVQQLNDGLSATVQPHPRQLPVGYLPLEHPELAIAEYERLRSGPFVGVCGAAGGQSVSLADPRFDPLWSALDRDARVLVLHPGTSPDTRLKAFYLANLLGNPTETALAAAQLIFGDVLSRNPGMRVLLVHCGGSTASMVGRWQRGYDTARPGIGSLIEAPKYAVRRLYVDCLAHDPEQVDHALFVFGDDKMVLGSDWPFAMGTDDPYSQVKHCGKVLAGRISTTNAERLLRRYQTP